MNTVEPIRSKEQIEAIKRIALEEGGERGRRDHLLFCVGINVGLRISDLVSLRVGDVRGRERIQKREKKTGKETSILLNSALRREIAMMTRGRKDEEWLFQSRQKSRRTGLRKALTRQRCYQIINELCRAAGVEGKIGNHTLRKTFGYHFYMANNDVVSLMRHFNHSEQSFTLRYIGVYQDEMDDHLKKFRL